MTTYHYRVWIGFESNRIQLNISILEEATAYPTFIIQLLGNMTHLYETGCQPFGLWTTSNDCKRFKKDNRDKDPSRVSIIDGLSPIHQPTAANVT